MIKDNILEIKKNNLTIRKTRKINKLNLNNCKPFPNISCNGFIAVRKVVCSKDAKLFFTFSRNLILIYSLKNGHLIKKLKEHTKKITGICLSINHTFRLYSCSIDKTICEWDLLRGKCINKIYLKMKLWKIVCGKNTLMLHATLKQRSKIILLDNKTWKKKILFENNMIEDLNVNCTGQKFAVVGEKNCYFINMQGNFQVFNCPYHVTISCFHSTNPDSFALGCKGGEICLIHNLKRWEDKTIYHWHSKAVKALTFTKDGGYLVSGGEEAVLVLWQLATSFHQFIPHLGGPIIGVHIAPDESKFLISLSRNEIVALNCQTIRMEFSIQGLRMCGKFPKNNPFKAVTRPCFDPVTNALILQADNESLQFYDLENDQSLAILSIEENRNWISKHKKIERNQLDCFHISSNGQYLATCERRSTNSLLGNPYNNVILKIWKRDLNTFIIQLSLHTKIEKPHHNNKIKQILFRPGKNEFITVDEYGIFQFWKLEIKKGWICNFRGDYRKQKIRDVTFSFEGSLLFILVTKKVVIWSAQKGRLLRELLVDAKRAYVFGKFTPSLVLHTVNNNCVIWDILTLQQKKIMASNVSHVHSTKNTIALMQNKKIKEIHLFTLNDLE